MFTTLYSEISKSVSQKIANELNSPFLYFWSLNLLIAWFAPEFVQAKKWLLSQSSHTQIILLICSLVGYSIFKYIIKLASQGLLATLSGKHFKFIFKLWMRIFKKTREKKEKKLKGRYDCLREARNKGLLSFFEQIELSELEKKMEFAPFLGCTKAGNIIEHIVLRQYMWYGLDTATCWPRLWLLLPEPVKKEVSLNNDKVENNLYSMIFCFFFLLWSFSIHWISLAAVFAFIYFYHGLVENLKKHYTLVCSIFDCYRYLLYEALKMEVPSIQTEEHEVGKALTLYIRRGSKLPLKKKLGSQKIELDLS